jgi:alpha-tubulin suppressor-like RCC1 family protein
MKKRNELTKTGRRLSRHDQRWPLYAALLLTFAACDRLTMHEEAVIKASLTCDDCDSGERDSVRNLGIRAVPELSRALAGLTERRRDNLRLRFGAAYKRIAGVVQDSAAYVDRYIENFQATMQMRAAISLGDLGAEDELRQALDSADARGYRDDVIREIHRSIARIRQSVTWTDVAADSGYTCGLITSGDVYCWGQNHTGQLGDGSTQDRLEPVRVMSGPSMLDVDVRYFHSCSVNNDGEGFCWGLNHLGQLGDGTGRPQERPRRVVNVVDLTAISAGAGHTCADSAGRSVYCWGDNSRGQLGDGSTVSKSSPTRVLGGGSLTYASAGGAHTCALLRPIVPAGPPGDDAYCWGDNTYGQLGDGTTTSRLTRVPVSGMQDATRIGAGIFHNCAVVSGGEARCWGRNNGGQLGDGSRISRSTPVEVDGGHSFEQLSAGLYHTCGVTSGDEAMCWGDNTYGQLGDGTTEDRTQPVLVLGNLTFEVISAGAHHSCGVTTSGEAYCWGRNAEGGLGDGTSDDRDRPVRVMQLLLP